jgi:hypothetical protein
MKGSNVETSAPRLARRDSRWFAELPDRLQTAVESFSLEKQPGFKIVQALADEATLEGLQVDGGAAVIEGDELWFAPATTYVKLIYKPDDEEIFEFTDAYPARVEFEVTNNGVIEVKNVTIDVSSFYADVGVPSPSETSEAEEDTTPPF